MTFALLDMQLGMEAPFALLIQFVFAVIFSIITIILGLIIGLPIRLFNKLHIWWIKHFYIALIGTFIGISLLILSTLSPFIDHVNVNIEGVDRIQNIPNKYLAMIGWFLTALMTLHIFPPKNITENFEKYLKSIFSRKQNVL